MTSTSSEFKPQVNEVNAVIDKLTEHITNNQDRLDFLDILHQFRHTFDTSIVTQAHLTFHHTIPTADARPTSVRPFYKTPQQREVLHKEVEKLLHDNVTRGSASPWTSPVILKKKTDGTYRFIVDFRRLNAVTEKDAYPQPTTEELLNHLAGHRFFTKLDLKSGTRPDECTAHLSACDEQSDRHGTMELCCRLPGRYPHLLRLNKGTQETRGR
ncbi:unnamed protein product, partial [Rotaria magnacalcarata]